VIKQQQIGKEGGIIMDGRDIGTVVFPNAELKLFVVADFEVRLKRRLEEIKRSGEEISAEQVAANLRKRDKEETERSDSPLVRANDAILFDTSRHTRNSQLEAALEIVGSIL
jgi:cytidylate kinase